MSEKRRLGKGLGALIPEAVNGSVETSEVPLGEIQPNPLQPRQSFDDEKLQELAESIKEHGVLQAVVVSPTGEGGFFLVAGERRCRAAKIAGLRSIPAVIKSLDRKTMLEVALIENLQREDLNPVEEARSYRRLMQEFNYTQEQLAVRIGKSRPSIANSLRLLSLPDDILVLLARGEITAGQARPLLAIRDPIEQNKMARKIIEEGLSARDAEQITAGNSTYSGKRRKQEKPPVIDPHRTELETHIQRSLGTKVRLKQGKNGGTIEIYYYSEEDLERLIAKLLPEGL